LSSMIAAYLTFFEPAWVPDVSTYHKKTYLLGYPCASPTPASMARQIWPSKYAFVGYVFL
jgi:hypothetical protein